MWDFNTSQQKPMVVSKTLHAVHVFLLYLEKRFQHPDPKIMLTEKSVREVRGRCSCKGLESESGKRQYRGVEACRRKTRD